MKLLLGEGNFMNKLLVIDSLDFHVNTIGFTTALVLANAKSLATLRRPLVDDAKFTGRVLLEKVTENKLGLCLTVRLCAVVQGDINRRIKKPRQFFCASCFDSLLHLVNYVSLRPKYCGMRASQQKNQDKKITVHSHGYKVRRKLCHCRKIVKY